MKFDHSEEIYLTREPAMYHAKNFWPPDRTKNICVWRKVASRFRPIRWLRQGEIIPWTCRCNARANQVYELIIEGTEILKPVLKSFDAPPVPEWARFLIRCSESEKIHFKLRQSSLMINDVVFAFKIHAQITLTTGVSFSHKSMIFGHPETP